MTALAVSFRNPVLAWATPPEDDARFRRINGTVIALVLLFGLALPWLPVPDIVQDVVQPLPPPLAKLLLEDKPLPAPPPRAPEVLKKAETTEKAPEPAKLPDSKPQPDKKAPVPEARNPIPGKPPGEAIDAARRKATGVGLLAMKDQLAEMHSAPVAVQINPESIKPGLGVGTGVGVGVGAGTQPGLPVRSMITSNATGGSGGINVAGYSRDTGGGGLAGRSTTLVEGAAGGGGGGGPGGGGAGGTGKGLGAGPGAGGTAAN